MPKIVVKEIALISGTILVIISAVLGLSALGQDNSENSTKQGQAELFLQPDKGKFVLDKDFPVRVKLTTNTAINASEAEIYFPADKLEATSISFEGSIFSLWVVEPVCSNIDGTIQFSGILPNPGFQGEKGEILTITFRPKEKGEAQVNFGQALVLANDGKGTNILQESKGASFILEERKIYDLNSDGKINIYDLSILVANWGTPQNPQADLNHDGQVNLTDFSILIFKLI